MASTFYKTLITSTIIVVSALSVSACSTTSTPTPEPVPTTTPGEFVAPEITNVLWANNTVEELPLGHDLVIVIVSDTNDWSGKSSNPDVATYTNGYENETDSTNPVVKGLKKGTTTITMTNSVTNKEVVITVNVV